MPVPHIRLRKAVVRMFHAVSAETLENAVTMIRDRKWILTAENGGKTNPMTVSWGMIGVLWGRPVLNVYVRPQRYTYDFLLRQDRFSVSVLFPGNEDIYALCGSLSGRAEDKIAASGLIPVAVGDGIGYAQAETVIVCRTVYAQDLNPSAFRDASLTGQYYPGNDFHRVFCGEITGVYRNLPE